MAKFIKFNAYYGTFEDYGKNPKQTILFYTSVTNNVKDVEVLNEPILDWEVSKAGNITFKLPPCNVGYSAIQCKIGNIFIERNGELIWHGRAITDTFDEELNREIVCEGALNYLLDTHIKPLNVKHLARYKELFPDLIDCHNRSLSAASSILFGTSNWYKMRSSGTVEVGDSLIRLTSVENGDLDAGVWSNPSMWQYKNFVGWNVRISFKVVKSNSGNVSLRYGLILRDSAWVVNTYRVAIVEGPPITSSSNVSWSTFLGPGGLDGTGHENAFVGFFLYATGSSTLIDITDLKVEFYFDCRGASANSFPVFEGLRTGLERIPFDETQKVVNINDYPTTLDAINSIFINEYGGYLYVSYAQNEDDPYMKHAVLNYIYGTAEEDEPEGPLPEIRYGKNLISLKETTNWEGYPTVLIPLGRQKEPWEKSLPAPNVAYSSGKYIDKDGYVQSSSNGKYYVAELPVKPGEVYFIYGEGVNDQGLYSIINSSIEIIDHKTFSNSDGNWYQHVEIDIPDTAATLRVFFNNENQASTITDSIFIIHKYNIEDVEDYITLEGFNPDYTMRTDNLAGSKYYPSVDMDHIYEYGWIEQVVHFEDAESQTELWSKAARYQMKLQEVIKTYEVEAAELAPIIGDDDYIPIGMPGSYAKLVVPKMKIDKALCVTKVSLNLRNFARSTYSLANLPSPDLADLIAKGLY